MRLTLAVLASAVALHPLQAPAQDGESESRAIREVIEKAYVTGVFIARDTAAVRSGFHPDFVMSVYDEDRIIVASLDMWLERLQLDGQQSSDTVKHVFERVDVTGGTAVVKLQLWINGEHVYTDYFGLYRFTDGWKIVTKVFAAHS